MNRKIIFIGGLIALAFFAIAFWPVWRGLDGSQVVEVQQGSPLYDVAQWREPLRPLPEKVDDVNPERASLGLRLFHDPRLSRDNTVACASCHVLAEGGDDGRAVSPGVNGALGTLNSPTVFNARYNFAQFWDGRAANLAEQVQGPVHNPVEMATDWNEIIPKLQKDEAYPNAFSRAYPSQGMTPETIVNAIVEFEKTLVTPSRFDRYLRGEKDALSKDEIEGYRRFKDLGCASCHQGMNVGGNLFQQFGVMDDFFAERGTSSLADMGRYNVTKKDSDRHVFKVPSLRNVALTAPYFHDGSTPTLEAAVAIMGVYQLGRPLTEEDIHLIVAFLNTLTGTWQPLAAEEPEQAGGGHHD